MGQASDLGLITLVTSKNKKYKKLETKFEKKDEGYTRSRKKVKPVKGSFPRNFPKFKVVN